MKYGRGEIVWVKFPFADTAVAKLRPVLIISNSVVNKTGDYLLMQITTRLRNDVFSLPLTESDFSGSPLLRQSELRTHKISILNESLIAGNITRVNAGFMKKMAGEVIKLIS